MTSPTFFRWGGGAVLVGSLFFAISVAITLFVPGPLGLLGPPVVWDSWLGAVSGLVWLIGLPALYTVQSRGAGLIGLLGFMAFFLALLLLTIVLSVMSAIVFANYAPPSPAPAPPPLNFISYRLGSLLLITGAILFGIAILRTRVFASWTAWALMALSVLSTFLPFLSFASAIVLGRIATVLFVLLFTWYGYILAFQTRMFVEVVVEASDGSTSPTL